jgi:hypothetical protein
MTEIDDLFTRMDAHLDRLDAMRQEILDYLARRLAGRAAAPARLRRETLLLLVLRVALVILPV